MGGIAVMPLGQSGFRFEFGMTVVYIDPYLSDHVAEVDGPELRRLVPAERDPAKISDADWVLSTHIHLDHADPETLIPMSEASPACRFLCPNEVAEFLADSGLAAERITIARKRRYDLGPGLRVRPVPAAHTAIEYDTQGCLRFAGYVFEYEGRRVYHAGDTSPDDELLAELERLAPIDIAFLPVNERNYYRDRRGIVGNMTVREAFQMAEDIGAKTLVPMHWDMFAPNRVYPEEIETLYRLVHPPFELAINPERI